MTSQSEKSVAIGLLNLLETFIKSMFDVDTIPNHKEILRELNDDERKKWTSDIVPNFRSEKNDYLDRILECGVENSIPTLLSIAEEFKSKCVPERYLYDGSKWMEQVEDEYSDIKKAFLYKIRNSQNLSNSVRYQAGLLLINNAFTVEINYRKSFLQKRIRSIKDAALKKTAKSALQNMKLILADKDNLKAKLDFFNSYLPLVPDIEGRYLLLDQDLEYIIKVYCPDQKLEIPDMDSTSFSDAKNQDSKNVYILLFEWAWNYNPFCFCNRIIYDNVTPYIMLNYFREFNSTDDLDSVGATDLYIDKKYYDEIKQRLNGEDPFYVYWSLSSRLVGNQKEITGCDFLNEYGSINFAVSLKFFPKKRGYEDLRKISYSLSDEKISIDYQNPEWKDQEYYFELVDWRKFMKMHRIVWYEKTDEEQRFDAFVKKTTDPKRFRQ